jgi:endo-1,4-beta-mannosidase
LIKTVITRNNTITGILYKNDPSIMAWETGNELSNQGTYPPSEWTIDTCNTMKSLDANHMVIDGTYGKYLWPQEVLTKSCVDLLSNHYYNDITPPGFRLWEIAVIATLGLIAFIFGVLAVITCVRPRTFSWLLKDVHPL